MGENLILKELGMLGCKIKLQKTGCKRTSAIMLHRNNNALIISVLQDSAIVKTKLRFHFGASVLRGYETLLKNGYATHRFPESERNEIRTFVEQESGIVKCREYLPTSHG